MSPVVPKNIPHPSGFEGLMEAWPETSRVGTVQRRRDAMMANPTTLLTPIFLAIFSVSTITSRELSSNLERKASLRPVKCVYVVTTSKVTVFMSFHAQYPDIVQRRNALLDLMEALVGTGATCLISSELKRIGIERTVQLEEYLAHGVIILQSLQVGRSLVRVIQVEKMRETPVDTQLHPYRISENGIDIFAKESVF
jgi:KaiC/GvpD/RAD55 family RecA-like ATPase